MALTALQQLQQLMPPLDGQPIDLLLTLYIALAVLAVRLLSEKLFLPPLTRAFKQRLQGAASEPAKVKKQAYNVFNNTFIALSALFMTAWAWHVTAYNNGGCTVLRTEPCLSSWPDIPVTRQFKLVWLTVFGFYLYEMICTALGVGAVLR